jgi:hypothetical protein
MTGRLTQMEGFHATCSGLRPAGCSKPGPAARHGEGITEVMVKVEGLPPTARPDVTVLTIEVADGGWGAAGHGYTRKEFPEPVIKGARSDPDIPG